MSRAASVPSPRVMMNESQPEWGMGLVVKDLPKHWDLFFEHAGPRKFVKDLAKCLVPATMDPADLAALEAKAFGRLAKLEAGARTKSRVRTPVGAKARFANIEEQIALFETLFPGGFASDAFVKEERGPAGVPGKAGLKEAAITLAQRELSLESFEGATPEVVFESAVKLLKATTMVFPMEGALPFSAMDDESRTRALEGLKQLLHGDDDYGRRLETFAASVTMKDKQGTTKAVTWPFATVFGAFFNPAEFICVKPTAFASQAVTVGLTVGKTQPVSAAGYALFAEVASKTQELLLAAGHQPRDLMDVYSFIWRTHSHKPA